MADNKKAQKIPRRRIYFIEKAFQAKFISKFCTLVFLGGILTIGILYIWAMRSTTVSIVNSRVIVRTTADFILPILIQSVVVVTILVTIATIVMTLFISHKIAGPLYRFKKTMRTLGEGDFGDDFKIRNLDQLQDLAGSFNDMILKLRSELKALKKDFGVFEEKLKNISEDDLSGENKRAYLRELKKTSKELNKIMHYFKT